MKKKIAAVLVGIMVLSLAGCGGSAKTTENGAAKTTTLKLAFNQSENHPQYKALAEMSDELYELTDGAYEIEISPNELLGSQKDAFELVQSGTIQMAMVANSIVENVNGDFAVLGLPYAYDSTEHQKKVFTSGILDELFASTSANKFNVLAAFTAGSRCIYTDKPVETPEDLAGYKIRVMEAPTSIAMLNAMGGVATPMAQSEVYTAIQQGVINGGENNEITYADLKHYEVAPYFSYTRHLMIPDLLVINSDILSGMSEEHQQIMKDLCKKYTEREFEIWDEQLQSAIDTATEAGTTFTEVDITPFQDAVQPVIKEVVEKSESAQALYDSIRTLAE
ncbi:TRAP transporter substrate-binding protein [Anaerobium acetethylicum]|nr:TRAP transporter substrate-binding protein [Anaerobium acetethylicum]